MRGVSTAGQAVPDARHAFQPVNPALSATPVEMYIYGRIIPRVLRAQRVEDDGGASLPAAGLYGDMDAESQPLDGETRIRVLELEFV